MFFVFQDRCYNYAASVDFFVFVYIFFFYLVCLFMSNNHPSDCTLPRNSFSEYWRRKTGIFAQMTEKTVAHGGSQVYVKIRQIVECVKKW